MFVTKRIDDQKDENFDWTQYFSGRENLDIFEKFDKDQIILEIRKLLVEDNFKMTFVLSQVMRKLLCDIPLDNPNILELGAATGSLTRWLITQYGGSGVLVDRNQASYEAFLALRDTSKEQIAYKIQDIFELELTERFDLVCSFGLIEHFVDKADVLKVHLENVSPDGYVIIIVPMDSLLTRVFFEVHPELNLGYRELLTEGELKKILQNAGFKVIKTEISKGYAYEYVAALCKA